MSIIGGYTLHLYCDAPNCRFSGQLGEYYGERNINDALKYARHDGWKVDRHHNLCLCPLCARHVALKDLLPLWS